MTRSTTTRTTTTNRRLVRGLGVAAGATALAAGALSLGTAAASTGTHTMRFTGVQIKDVMFNNVDIATDRDVQSGRTTGYDVTSCVLHFSTKTASCDAAVARRAGIIYGHATVDLTTGKGSGKVTGGTRGFRGATGTITVAPGSTQNSSRLTLVYHF